MTECACCGEILSIAKGQIVVRMPFNRRGRFITILMCRPCFLANDLKPQSQWWSRPESIVWNLQRESTVKTRG